jgi:hypothetical protein
MTFAESEIILFNLMNEANKLNEEQISFLCWFLFRWSPANVGLLQSQRFWESVIFENQNSQFSVLRYQLFRKKNR